MRIIKLNSGEYAELKRAAEYCDRTDSLHLLRMQGSNAYGEATDDEFDDLREACGDYLTHVGFDEEYEPTSVGRTLETLIDKLYIS